MVAYSSVKMKLPGMKILVIQEPTGKVREAFRDLGHNAFSVGDKPSEIFSKYHIVYDANKLMYTAFHYELIISFVLLDRMFEVAPRVALIHSARNMQLKGLDPLNWTGKQGLAVTMAEQWGGLVTWTKR